ncbi:HpcH/HpaI aldolase family protein [Sphingosinicella terrae]|uniref:HpcH/HpaI aldolase family protein n=1 Tax=Sphingosinicella terrae TaxID=2172047 RepID=UPI000E0CC777|nr:aldolase/citrate lyase family protein [Sphingosinicella terrae]
MSYRLPTAGVHTGTFIKTPAPQIVEILALAGFDFAVLDEEHAPLERGDIDLAMIAGRAAGLPLFVRVRDKQPSTIASSLDSGAAGLLVPHVNTAVEAVSVLSAARFNGGTRGYSGSPRSSCYGTLPANEAVAAGDARPVIVQIESAAALANVSEIAATAIDGLFIGRADLALSLGGLGQDDLLLSQAIEDILEAGRLHSKPVGAFVSSLEEYRFFRSQGISWFVFSSDQGLLRAKAAEITASLSV